MKKKLKTIPCPNCNGTGSVESGEHEEPEVDGSWPIFIQCDVCLGKGKIQVEQQLLDEVKQREDAKQKEKDSLITKMPPDHPFFKNGWIVGKFASNRPDPKSHGKDPQPPT